MKKLFLDDIRIPKDAIGLVPSNMNQFYWENDLDVVKNYSEFCDYIQKYGSPDFVSFDHDLADDHYNDLFSDENWSKNDTDVVLKYDDYKEKTGYECAKWLVDYCLENGLQLPDYVVHSANPVGKKNIESYLLNAKKHLL